MPWSYGLFYCAIQRIFFSSATCHQRLLLKAGKRTILPTVGGASRASGLPQAAADAVSGRKPGPTLRPEAEDREKKAALPITGIAMPLTRRSCPGPSGERTNATITPIWPCETLCAPIMGGAESLAPPKQAQANVGRCSAIAGSGLSPSWALYGGRKEKQDKGRGRRWRLRPVTSARSAGSYREFPVYQKWGQNPACDISSAVTIPKHLLPQQKNRGHTSLLHCERLLFRTGRPTSKITPHETKIEVLPGAGKCDA